MIAVERPWKNRYAGATLPQKPLAVGIRAINPGALVAEAGDVVRQCRDLHSEGVGAWRLLCAPRPGDITIQDLNRARGGTAQ